MRARAASLLLVVAALGLASCAADTSHLDADQEQRLAAEGIVRRANNLVFRRTRDAGARRDDRRASIVVTRQTILIHTNGNVEFLLAPSSRRVARVARDHDRVRVQAGSGYSAEVWSFRPPDDPVGWATDIRSVIRSRGHQASAE